MIKIIMVIVPKNARHISLAVLPTKLYALMIDLASQLFFIEAKMQSISLLKKILKKTIIAKK